MQISVEIFSLIRENQHSRESNVSTPNNREDKQTQRRPQEERHLKMQLRVSALIYQFFKVITLAKYVLTLLELK